MCSCRACPNRSPGKPIVGRIGPEVIPPTGWLAAGLLALLVLGLCLGSYVLFQRWSGRANFSLVGLLPFSLAALVLAFAELRAADAFIWSALIGSLVWNLAAALGPKEAKWALEVSRAAGCPATDHLLLSPFLPGVVMPGWDERTLNILAGIEAFTLAGILPVVDALLVRRSARN